ncbi:sigma-70 family RNA polymerase sigma factor [Gilvimarinus sp. SDUM040013]|uniref:RNA polymerase sigma factor n=1 Tax=Gilvimarinus gilvus TaxID=3058038 RepID=A0ABU4S194_9GAMM|nr:sigma-70 family RNA polymerase sigma factor [Gilvimarinus sp. SDUM040013]MDO3384665.1 sigma-70 family RNA polymerase sigma factor [Gilvimarinus sp. SDUM040013]MDX6850251.1 sigma-70 family RNA polymerase sigma factor [Gilvimarinus sp. SDUM040013]
MDISDHVLIERTVKSQDQHAYSQLVRRYQSRLRVALRQMCNGDEALADDIAQEAFIKAYKALAGFKSESQFFTWLYQIARNQLVSHLRKKFPEVDSEAVERAGASTVAPGSGEMIKRDLGQAMAQLSAHQREAIHLTYQLGHSNEEVANLMHLPVGTIKSHILRGKAKLKEILHEWQGETPNEFG